MNKAKIFFKDELAGHLTKDEDSSSCVFEYLPTYQGPPVSLTMPTSQRVYKFDYFPSFFEGLLPEGHQLEALLAQYKIGHGDYFSQLIIAGAEPVGAVSVTGDDEDPS